MSRFFLHSTAIIETQQIGAGTKVGAFTRILSGATIGKDCDLGDYVRVEKDATLGNRVTVENGVHLRGVTLEEDVFIGSNVAFANDVYKSDVRTRIGKGASIGANATIFPGLTLGQYSVIEAGTVVTRDVPPNAIVSGAPAHITGYVSTSGAKNIEARKVNALSEPLAVKRAKIIKLPRFSDLRGSLTFGEYDQHLPFIPKRYFVVFDVPGMETRGEHAHKHSQQFLICLRGSCAVVVDDGKYRDEINLSAPDIGLYLPAMIWGIQYKFTPDATLLCLASDIYDADDYIRDYNQYMQAINKSRRKNAK